MNGNSEPRYAHLNILVVEDNVVNQKVTAAMLQHFNINVDIAENGKVAMEMVKNTKYDLIFMDCQMPVKDGFETTKAIRVMVDGQTKKDVTIIAMTANSSESDQKKCFESGMNDFVAKPAELEDVSSILTKWINLGD